MGKSLATGRLVIADLKFRNTCNLWPAEQGRAHLGILGVDVVAFRT
jgi:hypothetical protein